MDRKRVENLLTIAKCGDPYMPGSVELGELCKAWLALDAAPVETLHHLGGGHLAAELVLPEVWMALDGQRVRLVATPASGGQGDG